MQIAPILSVELCIAQIPHPFSMLLKITPTPSVNSCSRYLPLMLQAAPLPFHLLGQIPLRTL